MKKRYGQIVKSCLRIAAWAAVVLVAGGILLLFTKNNYASLAEIAVGLGLIITVAIISRRRNNNIDYFFDIIARQSGEISANLLGAFPAPVAVVHIDGSIYWCNDKFSELFADADVFDEKIEALLADIKWGEILKSASRYEKEISLNDRRFLFAADVISNKHTPQSSEDKISVYVYLIDKTKEYTLKRMYSNDKTDVAIINIDNYDDVLQRINDNERQQVLSKISKYVNSWAEQSHAILKNTDRDRYYMLFEHKYLSQYVESKFDILTEIRKIGEEIRLPVSISVGIGIGGTLEKNDSYARSALDMALGRGGDQVSIKDDTQYKFYGSKARDYEKSTRVKTRAVAVALKDFIKNSDKVIFMGHSGADYDSFGAALGLQRAARALSKQPYIVHDGNSPAIKQLYEEVKSIPEYKGMLINPDEAMDIFTKDTLVVILDTHRKSMLPCPELSERAAKIVLIDHHRRSTDFITPCSLIYHEPYASSACEMTTELLEYMNLGSSLTPLEAEALYTGILMDTKNFILKTGVRTFEAASYLKRLGLNTVDVKKLFNVNKEEYDQRADIVRTSVVVAPQIAVARCYDKIPNIRVISSQAADDMLTINGIHASIVLYPSENSVGVSARSLGNINVQLIMEYLGGGGHSTVAGAQIKEKNIDTAFEDVKEAVDKYIKDNME